MTERKFTFHNHPLHEGFNTVPCKWCETGDFDHYDTFNWYEELLESSLNRPSHCQHPLDVYWTGYYVRGPYKCCICDKEPFGVIYRYCSLCNITVCVSCLRDPPPFTVYFFKGHHHKLTLLARAVTFACNACGTEGKRDPYVCFECSFMIHKDCIYLPRVININRHDHRISRTFHLPQGIWECGVCRQNINCAYGAFTCTRCPNYAVHSKCATKADVWDGKELEKEPEEEEIEDPFKVINENDIIHFSHQEHILRLGEDNANMRCDGCILPINDDPVYKCVVCNFCLHITCANLPRKKRHFLNNHKLTLLVDNDEGFQCLACKNMCSGFRYGCRETDYCLDAVFDIRCCSISEPFRHELHQHPLYRISTAPAKCHGCNESSDNVLSCIKCDYVLGMECAALPRKVKHRCDDHFLSLCQGMGNAKDDLWCDICETKTDPCVWYYTCDICGVTLHVTCVLGDYCYTKPGYVVPGIELLPNNGVSRPLCIGCKSHCRFPFFVKHTEDGSVTYGCSTRYCKGVLFVI